MSPQYKLLKRILFWGIPLYLMVALYLVLDPFKVLWSYDNCYAEDPFVEKNRDYVSMSVFDRYNSEMKYDSFIFGNSRTQNWNLDEWKDYLEDTSSTIVLNSNGETLFGLYCKVKYVDAKGNKLNHALLVVDHELLSCTESRNNIVSYVAPQTVDYSNLLQFHLLYLESFFEWNFFRAYLDMKITGVYKPYMNRSLTQDRFEYDVRRNWRKYDNYERKIQEGYYYDNERMSYFENTQFPEDSSRVVIKERQMEMLNEIADIFARHRTDYKIVINPLWDQKKMSAKDLETLTEIFGKSRVFDFSGVNEITTDYHNYFENSHYRGCVASRMMKEIYR